MSEAMITGIAIVMVLGAVLALASVSGLISRGRRHSQSVDARNTMRSDYRARGGQGEPPNLPEYAKPAVLSPGEAPLIIAIILAALLFAGYMLYRRSEQLQQGPEVPARYEDAREAMPARGVRRYGPAASESAIREGMRLREENPEAWNEWYRCRQRCGYTGRDDDEPTSRDVTEDQRQEMARRRAACGWQACPEPVSRDASER